MTHPGYMTEQKRSYGQQNIIHASDYISTEQVRQEAVTRNTYGYLPMSQRQDAQVQQVIQQRHGLIGENIINDTLTKSERRQSAKDREWMTRTVTSRPSVKTQHSSDHNSRQRTYESEYITRFGAPAPLETAQPDFHEIAKRELEEAKECTQQPHSYDHRLPQSVRAHHETVTLSSLHGMNYPVHRKLYNDLEPENNPEYSFDMSTHIDRMRPSELLPYRVGNGRYKRDAPGS